MLKPFAALIEPENLIVAGSPKMSCNMGSDKSFGLPDSKIKRPAQQPVFAFGMRLISGRQNASHDFVKATLI